MKRGGFRKPDREKIDAMLARQAERRTAAALRQRQKVRENGGRKPMPRENPKRKKKLRAEQFGDVAEKIKRMPCCWCFPWLYADDHPLPEPGHGRISDPSHTRTRGAGGKKDEQVPHCRKHHRLFEAWGKKKNEHHEVETGVHTGRLAARIYAEMGEAA